MNIVSKTLEKAFVRYSSFRPNSKTLSELPSLELLARSVTLYSSVSLTEICLVMINPSSSILSISHRLKRL